MLEKQCFVQFDFAVDFWLFLFCLETKLSGVNGCVCVYMGVRVCVCVCVCVCVYFNLYDYHGNL